MKLCVIGSGTMGRGIVALFTRVPFVTEIRWWGRPEGNIRSRIEELQRDVLKQCKRANVPESEAMQMLGKVEVVHDLHVLADADFYIEAVSEDMSLKKKIILQLSEIIPSEAIVATNTSSLSITELSMCLKQPERFIGMHFFNPTAVMQLVEVVVGLTTAQETLDRAKEIIQMLGKKAVTVNDSPGFIVNRMLIPMINEAVAIYAEGIAVKEDIDSAMKLGANHPIGPIALADLIGTDVCLSIMETLHEETGDPKYRAHPLLRQYVRAGRLGRKVRRGFYDY